VPPAHSAPRFPAPVTGGDRVQPPPARSSTVAPAARRRRSRGEGLSGPPTSQVRPALHMKPGSSLSSAKTPPPSQLSPAETTPAPAREGPPDRRSAQKRLPQDGSSRRAGTADSRVARMAMCSGCTRPDPRHGRVDYRECTVIRMPPYGPCRQLRPDDRP
jgi:hypothetical protein